MSTTRARQLLSGTLTLGIALAAGSAHAALQDRDLDGDSVTDAYYDTDLNITWLRNANMLNGGTFWSTAMAWVDGLDFGSYTDWRLPTSDTCLGFNCTGSEMGHLWYVELGNTAGQVTNTGGFQNLLSDPAWRMFWTSTEYVYPGTVYVFDPFDGAQTWDGNGLLYHAMAVRDGDVRGVVPEPATSALALLGLASLGLAGRRPATFLGPVHTRCVPT